MRQSETKTSGASAESRGSESPLGSRVRLSGDLVSDVYDAAEMANADPKAFVRDAVRAALGDTDAEGRISIEGMQHSEQMGDVTLGQPVSAHAERVAGQRDTDAKTFVQDAVAGAVEAAYGDDRRLQQPAGPDRWLPFFDPLGVLEAATNGALRDPLFSALRESARNAGVRDGGDGSGGG